MHLASISVRITRKFGMSRTFQRVLFLNDYHPALPKIQMG